MHQRASRMFQVVLFLGTGFPQGVLRQHVAAQEVAGERDDVLWVGAISVEEHTDSILLTPIARRDGDGWSVPWPEALSPMPIEISVDSAGRIDPGAVMAALPLDMSDPRSPRIAAPHRWLHYGGFRAESPSRSLEPILLRVTGLAPFPAYCHMMWKLRARASGALEPETVVGRMRLGVAVSRRPDEVLREADIAGLNEIAAQLGYERRTNWRVVGVRYRNFSWLGLFRFGDTVLGVVYNEGYEGSVYNLVELDGENSRIVASFHRGGC